MDITITIPDDENDKILKGVAVNRKYQQKTIKDMKEIDNPVSMDQFVADEVREFLIESFVASEIQVVEDQRISVRESARTQADTITVVCKI